MKNFFRNIHLYLSLAAGLVIAVICLTGAILVFEKEMQHSIYPERYYVKPADARVPLASLAEEVKKQIPGATVSSAKVYTNPERSVEISFAEKEPKKAGGENREKTVAGTGKKSGTEAEGKPGEKGRKGGKEGGKNNTQAFMNPYTGELISQYKHRNSFFFTVFATHRWLLNEETGKIITGVSTVFFLFILLTGIVLWWPKKNMVLKQRLTIKSNGSWKRLNHDLHIVIGFYTAIFLFAFAFTGLAWSFKWFNDAIFTVTGSENKPFDPPKSAVIAGGKTISLDAALQAAKTYAPNAEFYNINLPKADSDAVAITVMPKEAVHEKATNQIFLDQYSGAYIGRQLYAEKNLGQRVRSTFYPVHVGSIGGMPGRIIAFISCIAGFTFPITGIIMWLNRLKKQKKGKKGNHKTRSARPA